MSTPLYLVKPADISSLSPAEQQWAAITSFTGKENTLCLVAEGGNLQKVLVGTGEQYNTWTLAHLPATLPAGEYTLATPVTPADASRLLLGWKLACYRFTRYREAARPLPALAPVTGVNMRAIEAEAAAMTLGRDLVNTPAGDMLPSHLATIAQQVATEHGASCRILTGGELLGANYPLVYAVGKASADAPRLIDIRWGNPAHPKVTLVGKGVCFDSGGLDIKGASNMKLMKKDMGGAAITLSLAQLVMTMKLPVCLRLLLPAVENAISGNAMRPLDIIRSRKGITVEIGDTDAEGRLILADCLWEASQEKPDLLIDIATLTGAARVAVGTEMPALFCNNGDLAGAIIEAGRQVDEHLWPLPLHSPYRSMLDSKIADLSSTPSSSYGGAITAALFLQEFVEPGIPWVHLDTMAWNVRSLPGRPEGGEAQCLRALWKYLSSRFILAA